MKKSLLAMALLGAFAGTASAQSSVTLYGIVDAYVGYRTAGDRVAPAAGPGDSKWLLGDGGEVNGRRTSRFGFRGVEDLGGGLSAFFTLEQGYALDTGVSADPNSQFQRQAFVGIKSTTFGALALGRLYALSYDMNTVMDPTDKGELKTDETISFSGTQAGVFNGIGNVAVKFINESGTRINNAVRYTTPNYGGFEALLEGGAGEGSTSRYQAVRLQYKGGPINVAASYEEFDGGFLNTGNYNKVATVAANYDFSVVKVFAGYQQTKDLGSATAISNRYDDQNTYTVGATVPLGSFLLHANYIDTKLDSKVAGLGDAKISKYGIAAEYLLSKRTILYAAYTEKGGDLKQFATAKREITLLGVNHSF